MTAGLGGMGGAQPLAATMAGASCLVNEFQPSRIDMRLRTGYLDIQAKNLQKALSIIETSCKDRKPVSVGLVGNAAEIFPELVRPGVPPDVVTDQTSAHDPISGKGLEPERMGIEARERPEIGGMRSEALDGRV